MDGSILAMILASPLYVIGAGIIIWLLARNGSLGAKKDLWMGIGGFALVIGLLIYANPGMTASSGAPGINAPANAAALANAGQASQVGPGFATVGIPLRAHLTLNNTAESYQGGEFTLNSDKGDFQIVNGGGSTAGTSFNAGVLQTYTGTALNSSTSGFYGAPVQFFVGTTPRTVDAQVKQFVQPMLRIWDVIGSRNLSGYYNDATDSNVSDHTPLALTAGGSPGTVELRMDVGRVAAYHVFGDGEHALVLCESASPAVFDNQWSSVSGTTFTKMANLPQLANADSQRNCWELDTKQVTAAQGELAIARGQVAVISGASKANYTIAVYDQAAFRSTDGKTIKVAIGTDAPTSVTVGAVDPTTRIVT